MHAPANQEHPPADPAAEELNRIVEQAENLLRSLGDDTGEAADAVRQRVTVTLEQAKARLAATADQAEQLAKSFADRADDFVHQHPWQAVGIAALLGAVAAFLVTKAVR